MQAAAPVRVAFQGFRGAYSEAAGLELFGPANVELVGHPTFDACFQAVSSGQCEYAILPMENSMGGSVSENFDLQLKYQLHSVAELNKRVQHALLVLPGTKKSDVKIVASHPQALSQCAHYLETQMPHAKPLQESDTAGTAKKIAEEKLSGWAAICSKAAAKVYGLEVIDEDIQDAKDNVTRFLLYSRVPVDASKVELPLKASIVFTIGNRAGALHQALAPFAKYNVNLTKLESRPDRRRDGVQSVRDPGALTFLYGSLFLKDIAPYVEDETSVEMEEGKFKAMFFLDLTLSAGAREALHDLAVISPFLRVLGVYAAGGPLLDNVAKRLGVAEGTSFAIGRPTTPGASLQSSSSSSSKKAKVDEPRKLVIAIVGFGNFGQFLAKQMVAHGHRIMAWSRSNYSVQAQALGVEFFSSSVEAMLTSCKVDVVVLSTSILSFADVVASIPARLVDQTLVVDVLSVKLHARKIMLAAWGQQPGVDLLCTHPMFGPESGRYSWRGLPFVYERTRISDAERCEAFLKVFKQAGCRMIEMTCEDHDAKAANSQFVTHFTGRSLAELGLKPTGIDTKGFASLLDLVENTIKDSDDLFLALYRHNPRAAATLDQLRNSVEGVSARLQHAAEPDLLRIADALGRVQPSKTVKTHAAAMELKAKGADVITTLTVGEPHFGPPEAALKAAEACLRSAQGTKYTAVGGTPELKKAICDDYAKRKGVIYDPATEVLVSGGGKQSIFQAIHATCGPGDQVVIPAPYWVSYPDIALLAGAKPVFVQRRAELGYIMQPEQLRAALTKHTRMVILNNPCNPTGCFYSEAQLEALAAVLREPQFAHVLVLSDEIYERVIFDGNKHICFAALPEMRHRTLVVNGVAKGFAMTGMRIGWLCGPTKIVKACEKLQGQISSCACSVSQAAAAAALPLDPLVAGPGQANLDGLLSNRELAFGLLEKIPGLVTAKGGGAFYAFCSVRKPDGSPFGLTGEELCERLIKRTKGVAFVPGEAFGSSPESCSFRMSYAADPKQVQEGVARLADFIKEWRAEKP